MRIRIRRGLDLPIPGAPTGGIEPAPEVASVALLGDDFPGLRLSPEVEVGDRVRAGQCLLRDRRQPEIRLASPASGRVSAVRRGERRRLESVEVEVAGREAVAFPSSSLDALAGLSREAIAARLLESGEWIALRARPFGGIANPGSPPAAIFVRAMDSNPLAADPAPILAERQEDLRFGLTALSRLSDGPLFVCARPRALPGPLDVERARDVAVEGPHPAGLVGTHIHHLCPATVERPVWYLGYQDALSMGRLLRTGQVDPERVIALGGPAVQRPRLLRTRLGASTEALLAGELASAGCRIISGSPLSGRRVAGGAGFLGRYHEQLCALPEQLPTAPESWLLPARRGPRRVPRWRSLPGWTGALHGPASALLPVDLFDRAVPLRLPTGLLLRALAAGDVEAAVACGALELEEEDLALCSYLCPGKLDYGVLLRAALQVQEGRLA